MPPPSTRSNSPKPVGSQFTVSVEMLVIGFAALCTFGTEMGVREVRPGAGVRAPVAARPHGIPRWCPIGRIPGIGHTICRRSSHIRCTHSSRFSSPCPLISPPPTLYLIPQQT